MTVTRKCIILFEPQRTALFHQWTNDGCAIVEYSDGTCDRVKPWYIRFINEEVAMNSS